jgi:hypothetical protein
MASAENAAIIDQERKFGFPPHKSRIDDYDQRLLELFVHRPLFLKRKFKELFLPATFIAVSTAIPLTVDITV